jgi:hypothetical protein
MLWTIALIFLLIWGAGLVTSYTMGGLVHLLLLLAVAALVVRLLQARAVFLTAHQGRPREENLMKSGPAKTA